MDKNEKENMLYDLDNNLKTHKMLGLILLPVVPISGIISAINTKKILTNNFLNTKEGEELTRVYVNNIMEPINEKYDTFIKFPDTTNIQTTDVYNNIVLKIQNIADSLIYQVDAGFISGFSTTGRFEQIIVKDDMEAMFVDLSQASSKLIDTKIDFYNNIVQNSSMADSINATVLCCGIAGALISSLVVVGIPFARYSQLKHKYKKLEKEIAIKNQ